MYHKNLVKDYKSIGRRIIATNTKIEIKDLYKIFGPSPELMLDKVSEIEVTDSLQSMVILSTFKDNKVMPLF